MLLVTYLLPPSSQAPCSLPHQKDYFGNIYDSRVHGSSRLSPGYSSYRRATSSRSRVRSSFVICIAIRRPLIASNVMRRGVFVITRHKYKNGRTSYLVLPFFFMNSRTGVLLLSRILAGEQDLGFDLSLLLTGGVARDETRKPWRGCSHLERRRDAL